MQRFFAARISSKPADSDTPSSLYASCRDIDAGKDASGSDDDLATVQHRRRMCVSQPTPSGLHDQDARSACEAGWELQVPCNPRRPIATQLALPANEPTDMVGKRGLRFKRALYYDEDSQQKELRNEQSQRIKLQRAAINILTVQPGLCSSCSKLLAGAIAS